MALKTWSMEILNGVKLASSLWALARSVRVHLLLQCPNFDSSLRDMIGFMFLPFILSFVRVIGYAQGSILDLYVLLSLRENVPHLDNFMLHQVFVEGIGELQPTDERIGSHVVIAVIHQGHLALEITGVIFEALPRLHLDYEEVIIIFLSSYREAYW